MTSNSFTVGSHLFCERSNSYGKVVDVSVPDTDLYACSECGLLDDLNRIYHRAVTKFEVNQHKRELARRDKRLAYYAKQQAHRDAMERRQRQLDAEAKREIASAAIRTVHGASAKGGRA